MKTLLKILCLLLLITSYGEYSVSDPLPHEKNEQVTEIVILSDEDPGSLH